MSLEQLANDLEIEHSSTVHQNLEKLLPHLRFGETVEERYAKEKTYRQISRDLGISHTAAKDHIAYTLNLLKLPSVIEFIKGDSNSTEDTLLTYRVPLRLAKFLEALGTTDSKDLIEAIESKRVRKSSFTSQQREKLESLCNVQF